MHRTSLVMALVVSAPALLAQGVVGGRALDARSSTPARCTTVLLRDSAGTEIARTATRSDGTFEFVAPPSGVYHFRFHSPQFAPLDAPPDTLVPTSDWERTFNLAFQLINDGFIPEDTAGRTPPRQFPGEGVPEHPWLRGNGPGSGEVLMQFVIGSDGKPEKGSEVVISSTHPSFVRAVLEAVPRQRYEPAKLKGVPACLRVQQPYVFNRAR